jgi:hypothetical protein
VHQAHLFHRLPNGHLYLMGLTPFLNVPRQELQLDVSGLGETCVTLVLGVDVVFDLRHGELPGRRHSESITFGPRRN